MRLKNFVVDAEIRDNNIRHCGMYDFAFGEGGFNGEGIYIGTSSSQVRRRRCSDEIGGRGGRTIEARRLPWSGGLPNVYSKCCWRRLYNIASLI